MANLDLLKKISRAISPNKVDFSGVDAEINALKQKLEETVNIQTVDDVKYQLDKFKSKIDLTPLTDEIEKIGQVFVQKSKELQAQIDEKTKELETTKKTIGENEKGGSTKITFLTREINTLKNDLGQMDDLFQADIDAINNSVEDVKNIEGRVNETISGIVKGLSFYSTKKEAEKSLKEIQDKIDKLRLDLFERLSNINKGGSINRQMFIGGVDPLTRYTDMNLKAGSNVTITYVNNDTTKKVDVTIASSGGGGGSVRSINSISADTTAGSTSGTDYVYLVTGTTTLTLPTAVGNSNLYTVKNVGTGVVTVATTGVETIDASSTAVMPIQYTAIDLISDTANWNVT